MAFMLTLAQTARDFLDNYVAPLEMHDTPVCYAECSYRGAKVMIYRASGFCSGLTTPHAKA
jgi:hypothetical protein